MSRNIVIGIEGLVGAGKTSICRELLNCIPNSILLNGGNLYRSIVYILMNNKVNLNKLVNVNIKQIMDELEIEMKIENKETKFYYKGELIDENELQSSKSSMAVSTVGGIADNKQLFAFAKELIDNLKIKHNVIVSGRSIMKIYPETDYHFFITASLEERVKRKNMQYDGKIDLEELKAQIIKRDQLQEQAGFYELSKNSIQIDVTECKTVKDSTNKLLSHLELLV